MKLRALCDAQLSAKSVITSLLCSAKSHKNSKGLEDRSVTGTGSTESSKLEVPLRDTDTAKGTGSQVVAEETKVVKEVSPAKSTTAVPSTTTAESEATGQKEQLPSLAKTCSKTNFDAVTKNAGMDLGMVPEHHPRVMGKLRHKPEAALCLQSNRQLRCCLEAKHVLITANVLHMHEENACLLIALTLFCFTVTTGTLDKKSVKYNASTSGFTTASVITGLNQPVWQSLSFPLFSIFPNHFPQFQVTQTRPTFCEKSRTVAPYSPQQIFPPPHTPIVNYITLVPPAYPYQQISPATLPSNIQDLPPMAGNGIQLPFSPSQGYGHADLLPLLGGKSSNLGVRCNP
uniref:Uncharacterized protein n=1 Tax=Strigops habroptila TaxID=2489341 RepID=A0A672UE55_STRHB